MSVKKNKSQKRRKAFDALTAQLCRYATERKASWQPPFSETPHREEGVSASGVTPSAGPTPRDTPNRGTGRCCRLPALPCRLLQPPRRAQANPAAISRSRLSSGSSAPGPRSQTWGWPEGHASRRQTAPSLGAAAHPTALPSRPLPPRSRFASGRRTAEGQPEAPG